MIFEGFRPGLGRWKRESGRSRVCRVLSRGGMVLRAVRRVQLGYPLEKFRWRKTAPRGLMAE